MAKTMPTGFDASKLDPAKFRGGLPVILDDWKDVAQLQHWAWSRSGLRLPSKPFNPPWKTASAVLTVVTSGSGLYNLDTWNPAGVPQRRIEVAGTKYYRFRFKGYGFQVHVEITATRFDAAGRTALGTWTAETGTGDWEDFQGDLDIAEASCHVSGSTANDLATIGFSIEAKALNGATAELFYPMIIEPDDDGSALPTS